MQGDQEKNVELIKRVKCLSFFCLYVEEYRLPSKDFKYCSQEHHFPLSLMVADWQRMYTMKDAKVRECT
jgi:hypothetical protein